MMNEAVTKSIDSFLDVFSVLKKHIKTSAVKSA
jgi:hypothetical protein